MTDYFTNYAQSLEKEAADNIYNNLAGITGSLGKSVFDLVSQDAARPVSNRQYSVGDAALYGAVSGLLSGGLGSLGQQKAADDYGLAQGVLFGGSLERPEGLSRSLYKRSLGYRDLIKSRIAQDMAQKEADLARDIRGTGVKDLNKAVLDLELIPAKREAEESYLASLGRQNIKDSGGEVTQDGAPAAPIARAPLTTYGKYLSGLEDDATSAVEKLPSVTKLRTTRAAIGQISNMADLDTASSDIPFATLFIGGLDGSVVREGEYARVQGANPILNKYLRQIESTLNGRSALGTEIKKQMFNELLLMESGLAEQAQLDVGEIVDIAQKRGASPEYIRKPDFSLEYQPFEVDQGGIAPTSQADYLNQGQPQPPQQPQGAGIRVDQNIPPGMKLQMNPRTGETRIVPQ